MSTDALRAPFLYFGGKSRIAAAVWSAIGDPDLYVEPFIGSAAVLLSRPHAPRREIINDLDGFVVNFWRAIQHDRKSVIALVRWPVHELELQARHRWLCTAERKSEFLDRMARDPKFFCAKTAAWWCWGMAAWVGSGFCEGQWRPDTPEKSTGTGLRNPKKPRLKPQGVLSLTRDVETWFDRLADRLARVTVLCGDWSRCFWKSDLASADCAIFLDPPYDARTGRSMSIYRVEMGCTDEVEAFCRRHGRRRNLRIALAGQRGEYKLPGWRTLDWKRTGGLARTEEAKARAAQERLWLSPHCLPVPRNLVPRGVS